MEGHCSTGQNPQWAIVPMEEEEEVVGQTNDDVAGMENITIREAMNIFFLRTEIQYDEMGGMCD